MGKAMVAKILVENGRFVMENTGKEWFSLLCEFVKGNECMDAELRINSSKKIELWIAESPRLEVRLNCIILEREFATNFDKYRTAFEQNSFPANWEKTATKFCEEHGVLLNKNPVLQYEEASREEEVRETVQEVEGKDLKQKNGNTTVLADIGGKQVWAKVFKDKQNDDVKIAIWTKSEDGESREKVLTKSQAENGSTALATIMSNYDINYTIKKADGETESIKRKTINVAYNKLKDLLKKVEELEDPQMGFNLTEIQRFVLQELDAGVGRKAVGIYKAELKDPNLIGCTRKVLEAILEDTGWSVCSLCDSLLQRKLMKTDKHRKQLTLSSGKKIYVFKRRA